MRGEGVVEVDDTAAVLDGFAGLPGRQRHGQLERGDRNYGATRLPGDGIRPRELLETRDPPVRSGASARSSWTAEGSSGKVGATGPGSQGLGDSGRDLAATATQGHHGSTGATGIRESSRADVREHSGILQQ